MKTSSRIILWVGLVVYGLALFSALTFYRLPADKILSGIVERMTGGDVIVSAGKLSSAPWKGHRLEDLTWTIRSGDSVLVERMEHLTLSPNFLRLFQGYVPFALKGAMAKGTFQVSAGISMIPGLHNGYAKIRLTGIHLGDVEALSVLAQRKIKGRLTAQADLNGTFKDLTKLNGRGAFMVEDGAVDILGDGLGIRNFPFARITLPFSVGNGVLDLKGGEIVGPLFGGNLEGQIRLHHDLQASPLQIKAAIIPGGFPSDGQTRETALRGAGPIVIELQGTIGTPLISWSGASP